VELRVQWLLAKGHSLSRLDAVMDWESFRPLLDAVWDKPAQGPGGPRPNDSLKMFKVLLVDGSEGEFYADSAYRSADAD